MTGFLGSFSRLGSTCGFLKSEVMGSMQWFDNLCTSGAHMLTTSKHVLIGFYSRHCNSFIITTVILIIKLITRLLCPINVRCWEEHDQYLHIHAPVVLVMLLFAWGGHYRGVRDPCSMHGWRAQHQRMRKPAERTSPETWLTTELKPFWKNVWKNEPRRATDDKSIRPLKLKKRSQLCSVHIFIFIL